MHINEKQENLQALNPGWKRSAVYVSVMVCDDCEGLYIVTYTNYGTNGF
jgi:hypothetical protein